jgi:hypothetical protein
MTGVNRLQLEQVRFRMFAWVLFWLVGHNRTGTARTITSSD